MNSNYIRVGDYFIPELTLPDESRPIGKWGQMHREYLREYKPIQYNCLLLSGKLFPFVGTPFKTHLGFQRDGKFLWLWVSNKGVECPVG